MQGEAEIEEEEEEPLPFKMRLSGFTPSGTVKILFSESIVITPSNSSESV